MTQSFKRARAFKRSSRGGRRIFGGADERRFKDRHNNFSEDKFNDHVAPVGAKSSNVKQKAEIAHFYHLCARRGKPRVRGRIKSTTLTDLSL